MHTDVVIVGAGAAGHACARTLRAEGFEGRITLVNGENGPPINRTLVDKGVLPGLLAAEQIALPPLPGVDVVQDRAVALEHDPVRGARTVRLASGEIVEARAVVIATGGVPRRLGPGAAVEAGAPVFSLHDVADAEALRAAVPEPAGARIVIFGAGFVGSEAASYYAGAGAKVTLVARSELPGRAALGDAIAARLADLHRGHVDARFGRDVAAVHAGDGGGAGVELVRGGRAASAAGAAVVGGFPAPPIEGEMAEVACDAVLVATGSEPGSGWAGYPEGVPVDGWMRADRAGLYAVGAAARAPFGVAEHWDAAVAQGEVAARAVIHDVSGDASAGQPAPHRQATGFTLMVHGAVIAGRGARRNTDTEHVTELDTGGLLAEFRDAAGNITAVVGINAGRAVTEVVLSGAAG